MRWVVWSLAVIFLFYEFIIRVFPSVMVPDLMRSFSADATAIGTLSAFFFYAYAPMQIPIGILMDRYGSRCLLTFASLFCGVGGVMFGMARGLPPAQTGRFIMGVGSSVAFIGMVYVCSHWFPKKTRALMVGIGNSIGMLGAAWGVGPLGYTVKDFGWETTVFVLGIIGFLLAGLIFVVIRNEPKKVHDKPHHGDNIRLAIKDFRKVIGNWRTWVNALAALCFYMPTGAFASLWAVPFLETVHSFKPQVAGFAASMIFLGWIAGGPIIGFFSDKNRNRKRIIILSIILTAAFLLPVLYDPGLSTIIVYICLFFVGFFSSGQLLNFSLSMEINSISAKGSAIAVTNFVVAAGGAIMQPLIGYLLDSFWHGEMRGKVHVYSVESFQKAITIIPIALGIAIILCLFIKEIKTGKEEIDQFN